MKIVVFGAAGDVGRRAAGEAMARGHDVTGVVREAAQASRLPAGVRLAVADVADSASVAGVMVGHDAAIGAIRPPDGREGELAGLTRSMLDGAALTKVRLLVAGGASSLKLPGAAETALLESGWISEAFMPIARASFAQWEMCRAETRADWTYLCPPSMLVPGARTGVFRRGTDTLVVDADGESAISFEDFAVALIDEVEEPAHQRARFTVGY